MIGTFGVDVLIPVAASEATSAFIAKYPHLYMDLPEPELFADGRCEFADIRPDGAAASFALVDQPFDYEDSTAFSQRFVVSVDAHQARPLPEDLTFHTPFVPGLNDFYSANFYFGVGEARSDRGFLGRGAVGIISTIGDQRLEIIRMANNASFSGRETNSNPISFMYDPKTASVGGLTH